MIETELGSLIGDGPFKRSKYLDYKDDSEYHIFVFSKELEDKGYDIICKTNQLFYDDPVVKIINYEEFVQLTKSHIRPYILKLYKDNKKDLIDWHLIYEKDRIKAIISCILEHRDNVNMMKLE